MPEDRQAAVQHARPAPAARGRGAAPPGTADARPSGRRAASTERQRAIEQVCHHGGRLAVPAEKRGLVNIFSGRFGGSRTLQESSFLALAGGKPPASARKEDSLGEAPPLPNPHRFIRIDAMKRIGYIIRSYPRLSQTF